VSRKKSDFQFLPLLPVKRITGIGILLVIIVTAIASHFEAMTVATLAEKTMSTLKQQCISFNKVIEADRTKSLFRMTDMMRDLSTRLTEDNVNDGYLEAYVDSMRLTGVAVLDGGLKLEASGYTRDFMDADWKFSADGSRYADIIKYPNKIFAERLEVDGEFYDIAAVSRKDAPGMLIGFYHQPSGLISGNENDLESLLTGLDLEYNGQYVIVENSVARVASDETWKNRKVSDTAFLQALSQIPKDEMIHLVKIDGKRYWGYRSECEDYGICIYYPFFTIFSIAFQVGAAFAAVYFVLCYLYFAVRNRALYENQEKLTESNAKLTETVEMLRSLETIYFSLFYVDLEHNKYHTIYITPWLKNRIPHDGVYTELKQTFLDFMIVSDYCETVDQRMSAAYIQETLSQKNITDVRKSFYTDFQAIRGNDTRWCRVSVTVVDYGEGGKPVHVLALL